MDVLMWRRALAASLVPAVLVSCRAVLGLGDPLPYEDGGGNEQPVVTEDNSACGGANLVVDPSHCGRCNHSCRGTRCERGKCVPLGVSVGPHVYAVSDGRLFAIVNDEIVRVDTSGDAVRIAEKALVGASPRAMIANAQHVVWSGDDGVRVCSATGCPADGPEILSAAGKRTGPVVHVAPVHPTYPYVWVNFTDATVEKYGGAIPLSTDTRVERALCPSAFASASGGAYLSDAPGDRVWLYRATEQGRIAANVEDQCAIAAAGNNVFYTDSANVWRSEVNADGTLAPRVAIATNLVAPKALATDDEYVYWAASSAETSILRCPQTGCEGPPEVVVEGIPTIESIKSDGPFLYFSAFLNATVGRFIYRVAK
ncbi:MAG: hypothetical protein KIT84_42890 [Labilithrix sp.]|nr:hypothetical protein [Labilithrix sp.]MCW5817826.1 hypothetical protein [Labilithrix sp.]